MSNLPRRDKQLAVHLATSLVKLGEHDMELPIDWDEIQDADGWTFDVQTGSIPDQSRIRVQNYQAANWKGVKERVGLLIQDRAFVESV